MPYKVIVDFALVFTKSRSLLGKIPKIRKCVHRKTQNQQSS